jgi:hypothetical protein
VNPLDVLARIVKEHRGYTDGRDALADVQALVDAANLLWTYYLLPISDEQKDSVRAALARFADSPGAAE